MELGNKFLLYHISADAGEEPACPLRCFETLVKSGVDLLQIRQKKLNARQLFELAKALRSQLQGTGKTKLLLNERWEIALAAGLDGVHLSAGGIDEHLIRRRVPAGFIIGRSVHSVAEAIAASGAGADFVTAGPVYSTPSKTMLPPLGVDELCRIAEAVRMPVFALGGIAAANLEETLASGVAGVAGIRFFHRPQDVAEVIARRQRGSVSGGCDDHC